MTIPERLQHIKKIQTSGLTAQAKISALEAFVEQEKKADEEEKKQQNKLDEDLKSAISALTETKKAETQFIGVLKGEKGEDSQIPGPKGDKGDKGEGIQGKPGKDGKDGRDGVDGKDGKDGVDGKDGKIETQVIVKEVFKEITTKKGADRIHIKHIDGIDKFLSDWANSQQAVWQSVGRVIGGGNFKAGANITIAPDGTISSSGGAGGYVVETPTGTVDGSNTSFTVTATPVYIISDGITYFNNAGFTISGLTVTMTVPPTSYIRSFHS